MVYRGGRKKIHGFEDRPGEIAYLEKQKEKRMNNMSRTCETCGIPSNEPTYAEK